MLNEMRRTLVPILCTALLFSCAKEDPAVPDAPAPSPSTGLVKVNVRPVWNGVPFNKTNVYLSAGDERILLQQVKFYLSRITLVADAGARELSDAELLDITNGAVSRVFTTDTGMVDSLRFGLGLPPDLNATDITTVPPNDPLGNNGGMYWTWASMYRFLIFDGRFDTDPSASGTPPFPFSIHTGRDTCYRHTTLPLQLSISASDTARIDLDVDLARFFTDGNVILKMSDGSQSHGEVEELGQALKLSDLAIKAVQLQ